MTELINQQITSSPSSFTNRGDVYKSPSYQYLVTLNSNESRRTMESHLNSIARILGLNFHYEIQWEKVDSAIVYLIREKLKTTDLSYKTINTKITAIKQTMESAFASGLISSEIYQRIKLVKQIPGVKVRSQRLVQHNEIKTFLSACDDGTLSGLRDQSLFLMMIGCGLRRAEVVGMNIDDLTAGSREIIIRGKGNKERKIWMPDIVEEHLSTYLLEVRGFGEGALFCRFYSDDEPAVKDDGKVKGMSLGAINYIFKKRALIKNISKFKPHDLRGTYATTLLQNGNDINTVKNLLGHESISTTQIYDLRDESTAKDAALKHRIF
jgi:integrase/recombinase XerD